MGYSTTSKKELLLCQIYFSMGHETASILPVHHWRSSAARRLRYKDGTITNSFQFLYLIWKQAPRFSITYEIMNDSNENEVQQYSLFNFSFAPQHSLSVLTTIVSRGGMASPPLLTMEQHNDWIHNMSTHRHWCFFFALLFLQQNNNVQSLWSWLCTILH